MLVERMNWAALNSPVYSSKELDQAFLSEGTFLHWRYVVA